MILPLVAIATPATYVKQPLRVFELDFEANLPIVRAAVKYNKHLVFPSTSEVYGMCHDEEFDPENSELVLRPDQQAALDLFLLQAADGPRDLGLRHGRPELHAVPPVQLDRRRAGFDQHAEGRQLARDHPVPRPHRARRTTSAWWTAASQKRAFTYIDDGIDALMKIIDNQDGVATGKIYNIGNPTNNYSIRDLADMMLKLAAEYPEYRESAKKVKIVETDFRRRTTARATRTCRTACRRSPTPARS